MRTGEARSHGTMVDRRTLEMIQQLAGRQVKAYINHDYSPDITRSVGVFENLRIDDEQDGSVLRGDFVAFESWRKARKADYERLFELAVRAPEEFGMSFSLYAAHVWLLDDGREVEIEAWDDTRPANAVNDLPVIRPSAVSSVDFVGEPSTTPALFSTRRKDGPSPAATNQRKPMKKVYSHFQYNEKALALAMQTIAADEKADADEVIHRVEAHLDEEKRKDTEANFAALQTEHETTKAELDKAAKAREKAEGDLAEAKAQLSAVQSELEATRRQLAFRIRPVNTGGAPATTDNTATPEQFRAMDPFKRGEFLKNGGKILETQTA